MNNKFIKKPNKNEQTNTNKLKEKRREGKTQKQIKEN